MLSTCLCVDSEKPPPCLQSRNRPFMVASHSLYLIAQGAA
jgi:hypothetical protein